MTMPTADPLDPREGHPLPAWSPLLDAMAQGVVLVDAGGRTREANLAATRILGLDRDLLLACRLPEPWSRSITADGAPPAAEDLPGLMAPGAATPVRGQILGWRRGDGRTLWLEVSTEPLQGGGALVSFADITEHRAQSRKLDRMTELYSALSQVNQAIVWSPTREALLDRICEVMVEFGKFAMACIGWDDPGTHEVRIVSQSGDAHGYLRSLRVRSDDSPLGQGGTGTAIREGRTVVKNDFLGVLETSPWREAAIRSGFAASAAIPLRSGGRTCGALMVYASEKDYFGAGEIGLLEEAAGDVDFALGHLEMDAQRKRAEQALLEREERYRTFFEHGPDGVLLLDPATARPIEFNDQVCRQLGYTREEFQALTLADIEAIETPEETARTIKGVLERGIADFETRQRTKDGEIRHVHVTAQHIHAGGLSVYHCVWRDITGRKTAEQALLRSERFLREAQSAGGVGCFSLDINLGIWESSETFDAIFGIGPDYPRDTGGWLDLVAADAREEHQQQLQALIQGKGPFDLEFRVRRRQDGRERWVSGQGSLDFDAHGQTTRLIGTMLDITGRKRAEAEILRLNESLEQRVKERTAQLEAANQELEAFSYSVSHDLRAPLQIVNGFTEALLQDCQASLDEAGRRYLVRIRQGVERMGHLIDDLLQLSKSSRGPLAVTACDLSGLAGRVARDLADLAPERRVELDIQPGLRVRADSRLMQVVLENLLGNAWKFTSRTGHPRIELGGTVAGGERAFFVRDNGAGFAMAEAGSLFGAFQRLHAASDFEGSGIGLAIVQRIIHRHGGRVWAEGEPGKGATFFFTIPDGVVQGGFSAG